MMIVLSSPSGAGKTTLARKLQKNNSNFQISISYTTRQPRSNEVNGKDYYFVSRLEFEKLINDPEVESKKLLKFCNLPWSKNCLEYYKRKDIISKTASNVQIRKAIYKHSKERYLPYKKFLDKYGSKYSWYKKI